MAGKHELNRDDDKGIGEHPVGTGLGAAGGAAAGAGVGMVGGPVGMAIGAAAGGVAGALGGKAIAAEATDGDDDAYWRENHTSRSYYQKGKDYSHYQPAYSYGSQSYKKFSGKKFDEVEADLRKDWDSDTTRATSFKWDEAKHAVRDSYDRAHTRTLQAGQTVAIPVTEEQLEVGKRQVQGGGVRVHTEVTERPVQEQVSLREEHVKVERRAVDRPATEADFQKAAANLEVTEKSEVAVAAKHARVTGEVVVGKQATERTETVRDTVRKTEVEVEQIDKSRPDVTTSSQETTRKKDVSR